MPGFIKQGPDSCCFLYTLCNARRYWGYTSPVPYDDQWEMLVDLAGCRHGTVINYERPATHLGISLHPINPHEEGFQGGVDPPTILTVVNPCEGTYLHACLLLELGDPWRMVGYRTDCDPEQLVDPRAIEWPGPQNSRHWNIRFQGPELKRENLKREAFGRGLENARVTHIPTGAQAESTDYKTLLANSERAIQRLRHKLADMWWAP